MIKPYNNYSKTSIECLEIHQFVIVSTWHEQCSWPLLVRSCPTLLKCIEISTNVPSIGPVILEIDFESWNVFEKSALRIPRGKR